MRAKQTEARIRQILSDIEAMRQNVEWGEYDHARQQLHDLEAALFAISCLEDRIANID